MQFVSLKKLSHLWLIALALGWSFDFLFWNKAPGISFPVLVALLLAGGFFLSWREGLRPSPRSLILLLPVGYFTAVTIVRLEPLTVLLSYALVMGALIVFAHTYLGGRWLRYGLVDYLMAFLTILWSAIYRAGEAWVKRPGQTGDFAPESGPRLAWKQALPALRGVLLAIPVLAIFSALLASADPIFSRSMESFLSVFRIEKLPEYLFRGAYILFLAYTLAGVYLYALTASQAEPLRGLEKPLVAPFFGLTESAIILGSVDLLFAFFVGIQFRYFFGGRANIHAAGFTYSQYARRGFGELVAVAVFSLALFLGLSAIARREKAGQRRLFSGLGIALVALVSIILVSAFQRLQLYEQAYGFTRLRAYTHVFMIWIGILLVAVAGLELAGRLRYFALAAAVSSLGFGVSLSVLNVDAFIVRENARRAILGAELDSRYLSTLSLDAVPALIELQRNEEIPPSARENIGGVLACYAAVMEAERQAAPWQSLHLARERARRLLEPYRSRVVESPASRKGGQWKVQVAGKERLCFTDWQGSNP